MRKSLQFSFRGWLLALGLLSALPFIALTGVLIHQMGELQRTAIESDLEQRSTAAANALRELLGRAVGYLNAIATSDAAVNQDMRGLYDHAQRVVHALPDVTAITLTREDGSMVFITSRPFGVAAPPTSQIESVRQVFTTRTPSVSGPFLGPVSGVPVVALGVPVMHDGRVVYCLRMVFRVSSMNQMLANLNLPDNWRATIVDGKGIIVARTHAANQFVGKRAPDSLLAAIPVAGKGVIGTTTLEGIPVVTAITNVPGWDWKVAIHVPRSILHAGVSTSMSLLVGAVLVALALGAAVSLLLSRSLKRQMDDLIVAAETGSDPPAAAPITNDGHIRELKRLHGALLGVREREESARHELHQAMVLTKDFSERLDAAQRDALTGLVGRVQFLSQVTTRLQEAGSASRVGHSLLFIDLDGFKAVNDNFGHEEGDRLLLDVADVLRSQIRSNDIACRLGGDEFLLFVQGTAQSSTDSAALIADRVIRRVNDVGHGVGCSIGIVPIAGDCPDVTCAIRRADAAMYEAKRRGKNRFAVFGAGVKADGSAWTSEVSRECKHPC